MRTSTMFVTKDHFIFVIKSTEPKTELYAAADYPAGNPIGFLSKGIIIPFLGAKTATGIQWTKYSEELSSPNFHTRSKNSLLGAVASSNDVEYFNIIPREGALVGEWKKISNITPEEGDVIEFSDTTFQINESCEVLIYRDLNTFEQMDVPKTENLDESIDLVFE